MNIPIEIFIKIIGYIPKKYEVEFTLRQVSKTFYKILYIDKILNTEWIISDKEERSKIYSKIIKK